MSELEKKFDHDHCLLTWEYEELVALLKRERDELRDKITLLEGAINILRE